MTKLKELSMTYLGKESMDKILPEVELISEMLEEDRDYDPTARRILEILETDQVKTEEDFYSLSEIIDAYRSEAMIGRALKNTFEEPVGAVEEMFGDPHKTYGRLVITKDGRRVEIDEDRNIVGPVDEADKPLPGHPEYTGDIKGALTKIATVKKSIIEPTEVGQYIPYEQRKQLEQSRKMDEYIASKQLELENIQQGPRERVLVKPQVTYSSLPPALVEDDLEVVLLYLENLGTISYEPESVVTTKHSFNLVFNPRRSKPAFIPAPGQKFELEWRGKPFQVMYVGNRFEYANLIFLCFGLIPKYEQTSASYELADETVEVENDL